MQELVIDGFHLTFADAVAVARASRPVALSPEARQRMAMGRAIVDDWVARRVPVYGVNTGFGDLARVSIGPEELARLQENLIASHAVGVGDPLDAEVVRAAMLLRANGLARGHSGVRPEVVETLLAFLNTGITPVIPAQGSLGASGDLAPLAHLARTLTGRGEVFYRGRRLPTPGALQRAGVRPLALAAKEGLSLINGTEIMGAHGALLAVDAENLIKVADIAGALSLEALTGLVLSFDPRVSQARPHPGQAAAAANVRRLVEGSTLLRQAGQGMPQDAYSLRAIPQVHGACRDALAWVRTVLGRELNATTDNPLVFADTGDLIPAANFHGQPLALSLDLAAMALAELGGISERRVERSVNPHLSGLPAFLVEHGGLNSGFMVVQYVCAALVSENKGLCHPASVDSIPTSAGQEDYVSMGAWAARKARMVLHNVERVLAAELLTAAQALEFRRTGRPGRGTSAVYRALRNQVPPLEADRDLDHDWMAAVQLVRSGKLVERVETSLGEPLHGLE